MNRIKAPLQSFQPCVQILKPKENPNRQRSCWEGHTQNVSAHNYNHHMWKMTEIKHVNVSMAPLSFCFFFSPCRRVVGGGGVLGGPLTFDGGDFSETRRFASNRD